MIDWIIAKLPAIIFVVVVISQVVRGFSKLRGSREEEPPAKADELEAERRAREIQEDIRRKIAERRGGRAAPPPPEAAPEPPVVVARDPTAIPVPEPLRRMLEQLERRTQPVPVPAPPPVLERRHAELERQEQLAEELRTLEEARTLAGRRATKLAASEAQQRGSQAGQLSAARGRVMDALHDPEALRRAFVLREVLGTPVGLR